MITSNNLKRILQQRGLLRTVISEPSDGTSFCHLSCDSRSVVPDTLFLCKGNAFRPEYLQDAIHCGCTAYISEVPYEVPQKISGYIVNDMRKAIAVVSAAFFEYDPDHPALIGITGTKGKTTTAWYLKAMLDLWQAELGKPQTGLISTVLNYDGIHRTDSSMTTPEAPTLHELIFNAKKSGLSHMTMEVSSQALKYKRVQELKFQVGIFLNISEDHISPQEHEDFEDYFSAKLSIFRQSQIACVNMDSDYQERILKAARKSGRMITFGRHPQANVHCCDILTAHDHITFRVECDHFSERFSLNMRGKFNIENAMAAIAAGYALGIPVHCMQEALASTHVPGRMEHFFSADGKICGIVDFAHNRLSFEKLFDAVFEEYPEYKKIITVFGCPGGKAFNRRRELGILAGLFSDYVYITIDDPGMESQETISEEVRRYVEMVGCACCCISDRKDAVRAAVAMAAAQREKTMILVLGRGSEKYQKIGTHSYRYPTDSDLLSDALRSCPCSLSLASDAR